MRGARGGGGIRLCGRFVGGGLLIETFDCRLCWELSWCLGSLFVALWWFCEVMRLVGGLFGGRGGLFETGIFDDFAG